MRLSNLLVAQVYGQGAYGTGSYGAQTISIGPIKLPATGATVWVIIAIVCFSGVVGLWVWRKRSKPPAV